MMALGGAVRDEATDDVWSIHPAISSTRVFLDVDTGSLYHFGKKKKESPWGRIRLKIHITDPVYYIPCVVDNRLEISRLPLRTRHRNHGRLCLEPRNGRLRRATLQHTHTQTYDYDCSKSVCSPCGCDPTRFRICLLINGNAVGCYNHWQRMLMG